ncbi:MAG: hypothetical protein WC603_03500 [Candidatus Paceibacterota bacterium]|jgi:hypothetical protein
MNNGWLPILVSQFFIIKFSLTDFIYGGRVKKILIMEEIKNLKPGTKIMVMVLGRELETIIDENKTQRFISNELLYHLVDIGVIDVNQIERKFIDKKITRDDIILFYIGLGYSVERLFFRFPQLTISNIYIK